MVSVTEPKKEEIDGFVDMLRGFKDYDVMQAFIDADIKVPEGERFYDPIYEEVWG